MSSGYRDGWALRRDGGCKGNEHGEPTWDNWVYCCPIEMTRSTDVDNNKRCTIRTSPSRSASTPRRCADPTMSLWSDSEGYFCCDSDLLGFRNDQFYKGCATESEIQKNGSWTKDDPEGQPSVSLSLTATSMTATSSSTMSASEPQGSSTNTGAIVGGVVGGVGGALIIVAAIWFLMRHRRSQVAAKGSDTNHHYAQPGYHSDTGPDHHHDVPQQEVMGSTRHPQELSGNNSGAKSFSELS